MDCFIIVDKLINFDKNYENWNPLKYINQRYFLLLRQHQEIINYLQTTLLYLTLFLQWKTVHNEILCVFFYFTCRVDVL